ncbi:hypothetical protein MMC21_000378 [Puttea exsequens]|nr:hypothetical protein [Puttea exsequens]
MSTIQQGSAPNPNPTPKSLLRRSTLVRKRDDDDRGPPSSTGKRAKVTFDSDVEVRTMDDWGKAPQLVQEEVRRAFAKRVVGDSSGYDKLKAIYDPRLDEENEPSPMTMRNYTAALLANVSALDRTNSDLVNSILNSDWLRRQEEYFNLYVRFLTSLASAHTTYMGNIMRMLVNNLAAKPPLDGQVLNVPPVTRSSIYARVHKAIEHLLQVVPAASRLLSSALVGEFPHETDSKRAHIVYVQNLLKLASYAPQFRSEILSLITRRVINIDVQVQVDLEGLADDIGEGLVDRIPDYHPDSLDDLEESDSSGDESESEFDGDDPDAARTRAIEKNVEKMDVLLDILFSTYHRTFAKGSESECSGTIDILLSQFITTILPTHRSRHTQFIIFHFAQQASAYIDNFVGSCLQIALDRNQTAIVRQASSAYLASFVARGAHVPSNIVRDVFDYLHSELDRLRQEHEPTCRGPDLRRYASFYVLVQALLYIFCFRWRDLENAQEDDSEDDGLTNTYVQEHQWKYGVKETLSSNIFSKLNPLKVCSPALVEEFAKIANHLGVVYVYHLLETNKRVRVQNLANNSYGALNRETALSANKDDSNRYLDDYFPFDPYHLPKSKRWMEDDYRKWAGIPSLDVQQEAESDTENEGTDSEIEEGTETDETQGSF